MRVESEVALKQGIREDARVPKHEIGAGYQRVRGRQIEDHGLDSVTVGVSVAVHNR